MLKGNIVNKVKDDSVDILVPRGSVIYGFPTSGKTSFKKALAARFIPTSDSDIVLEALHPAFKVQKPWRKDSSHEEKAAFRLAKNRVGATMRDQIYNGDVIFGFTNFYGDDSIVDGKYPIAFIPDSTRTVLDRMTLRGGDIVPRSIVRKWVQDVYQQAASLADIVVIFDENTGISDFCSTLGHEGATFTIPKDRIWKPQNTEARIRGVVLDITLHSYENQESYLERLWLKLPNDGDPAGFELWRSTKDEEPPWHSFDSYLHGSVTSKQARELGDFNLLYTVGAFTHVIGVRRWSYFSEIWKSSMVPYLLEKYGPTKNFFFSDPPADGASGGEFFGALRGLNISLNAI